MSRELSSFPLPPLHRMRLKDAGFLTVQDVIELKPSELSKEINLPMDEALAILSTVKGEVQHKNTSSTQSALDMLKDDELQQNIVTFSKNLDTMLGGGVPLGKITEFCGAPGIGKTQICIQLCVDVQLPVCFGGLDGEAIFIDTEGSFIVERVADFARAAVYHCEGRSKANPSPDYTRGLEGFGFERVLRGIHYYRCQNHIELLALIQLLPGILKDNSKIKLIVCDSVAFPFRHEFEDLSLRTRLLNGLAQSFIRMASQYKLAVVLTNQMTTKVRNEGPGESSSELAPALGESWGHASTIRVILFWRGTERQALLYKSPSHGETVAPYQITRDGIRDVLMPSADTSNVHGERTSPPTKRKKVDAQ